MLWDPIRIRLSISMPIQIQIQIRIQILVFLKLYTSWKIGNFFFSFTAMKVLSLIFVSKVS